VPRRISAAILALGKLPFQGALRPELGMGMRVVTRENCAIYFVVDEPAEVIRILGVLRGGQEHWPRLHRRLREE
jgi:toxin ParE1/3/4